MDKSQQDALRQVIELAMRDADYRQRLMTDPQGALAEIDETLDISVLSALFDESGSEQALDLLESMHAVPR